MSGLIDKQVVLDTIHRFFTEEIDKIPTKKTEDGEVLVIHKCQPLFEMNKAICKRIKALPSVTAEPKTGHWIMSEDGLYRPLCDKCGAHPWKGYIPTVEEATEVFKYCPNCGAKMQIEG